MHTTVAVSCIGLDLMCIASVCQCMVIWAMVNGTNFASFVLVAREL